MGDLDAAPEPEPGDEPEPQAARAAASSVAPVSEMMVRLRSMVLNLLEADEERIHNGRGPEVGGAAVEDEPSPGEDEDPLADLRDQVQVVLHQQDAGQAGQLGQQFAEPPPFGIGQARSGLVQKQQPGTGGDGP